MNDQASDPPVVKAAVPRREDRSFRTRRHEGRHVEGTGASADDIDDESDAAEEERLDEGLKETFPASDPVSAKHIT